MSHSPTPLLVSFTPPDDYHSCLTTELKNLGIPLPVLPYPHIVKTEMKIASWRWSRSVVESKVLRFEKVFGDETSFFVRSCTNYLIVCILDALLFKKKQFSNGGQLTSAWDDSILKGSVPVQVGMDESSHIRRRDLWSMSLMLIK